MFHSESKRAADTAQKEKDKSSSYVKCWPISCWPSPIGWYCSRWFRSSARVCTLSCHKDAGSEQNTNESS